MASLNASLNAFTNSKIASFWDPEVTKEWSHKGCFWNSALEREKSEMSKITGAMLCLLPILLVWDRWTRRTTTQTPSHLASQSQYVSLWKHIKWTSRTCPKRLVLVVLRKQSWSISYFHNVCRSSSKSHRKLGDKPALSTTVINSLAPGKSECDSENQIFKIVSLNGIFICSHDNALWWMPQDRTDLKSTLVQVMA